MKNQPFKLVAVAALMWIGHVSASVLYVDLNSTNPTPPFAGWSTAATDIQSAVDASTNGDLILATDGVYSAGGRVKYGTVTNRVVIDKPVTVESVNGPQATSIQGYQMPGVTNGDAAVRCVYLGEGASLIGFTLNGGATHYGSIYATDEFLDESGGAIWCGAAPNITFLDCTISDCIITGNTGGDFAGGAMGGTYYNCRIANNIAQDVAGGVDSAVLNNCVIANNIVNHSPSSPQGTSSTYGGGAEECTLIDCILAGNSADYGGGASSSDLYNCVITNNSAVLEGGACDGCYDINCTIVGNSAVEDGGGIYGTEAHNCIVYFNTAPTNANVTYYCTVDYSCTTPDPGGAANVTNDPAFVNRGYGNLRLKFNSPCINAGTNWYTTNNADSVSLTTDFDGNARIVSGTVDIGAYEFHGGVHYVDINGTNAVSPYLSWSNAATRIQDAVDAAGDGDLILVTNGVYASGGETVNGFTLTNRVAVKRLVTVESVNGPGATVIAGYQIPGVTNGDAAVRCVYLTNGATLTGFTLTNGATRATNANDWYNEEAGGAVWCDTTNPIIANCVIVGNSAGDSGGGAINGTFTNCVFLNNVAFDAGGAVYNGTLDHCTIGGNFAAWGGGGGFYPYWLANGSVVNDCALTNNSAGYEGGGIWGGTARRCVFSGNATTDQYYHDGSDSGGGAFGYPQGILDHCILSNNRSDSGGGAEETDLYNCVVYGNYAGTNGGGLDTCYAYNCTIANNTAGDYCGGAEGLLINCISYYNSAPSEANYDTNYSTLDFCCTAPLPSGGSENFTNPPQFLDLADNDFHLQSNSPCINSGNNFYLTNNFDSVNITVDSDGNARIAGGTVDTGAYEYQSPTSVISYAWLQQYGLPTDGSVDHADLDGTAFNVYQDWIAGLNPTNAASVLMMQTPQVNTNSTGLTVSWLSVNNRTYFLERATNLAAQPAFSTIQNDIAGQAGTTSVTDATATNGGPYFYRVRVQR